MPTPPPAFNNVRNQTLDLINALDQAELTRAALYEIDRDDGPNDELVEVHAVQIDNAWHLDVLYRDGRGYDYAAHDTRQAASTP